MGVQVLDSDLATLLDLLERVGRVEDIELGNRIEEAMSYEVPVFSLSPAERDTLLSVLDDPPPGRLPELRGVLARDHADRQR